MFVNGLTTQDTSALSQLENGICGFGYFCQAAWNTEVFHAEEVYRATFQDGAPHASGSHQEAEREQPEGAACADFVEGRWEGGWLDRQSHRRGLWLPRTDGGDDSPAFCRVWFS